MLLKEKRKGRCIIMEFKCGECPESKVLGDKLNTAM